MAEEDLDLVIQLGDYIYEGGISALAERRIVRKHNSDQVISTSRIRIFRPPTPLFPGWCLGTTTRSTTITRRARRKIPTSRRPRSFSSGDWQRRRPITSTCPCEIFPCPKVAISTCAYTGARPSGIWRKFTCWIRANIAPTRFVQEGTTSARIVPTGTRRLGRCSANSKKLGCSTGSRGPKQRGTLSRSRFGSASTDS